MNKKKIMLSKSRFLSGLQCHLRLRYSCFNRNLASETSYAQQAIFDMGHEVGELATRLYPGGILIEEDHLHHEEAVQTTLKVMRDKKAKSIYTQDTKRELLKTCQNISPNFMMNLCLSGIALKICTRLSSNIFISRASTAPFQLNPFSRPLYRTWITAICPFRKARRLLSNTYA